MSRTRLIVLTLATSAAALGTTAVDVAGSRPVAAPVASEVTSVRAHDAVEPTPLKVASPAPAPAAVRPRPVRTVTPTPPHPATQPATQPTPRHVVVAPRRVSHRALTPAQLLQRAVGRLPHYRTGDGTFVLERGLGSWGLTELHGSTVLISPTVPARRMYDVVAHEWSHVLSVKAYHGDVDKALARMNARFGGSGLTGAERAADCMARVMGATWTNYTSCSATRWRADARRLLTGQPV